MEEGLEKLLNDARAAVEKREYRRSCDLYERYLAADPTNENVVREFKALKIRATKMNVLGYKKLFFIILFIILFAALLFGIYKRW